MAESKFKISPIKSNNIHAELASKIMHMRSQFHIYHLQTVKYSTHKALNELYDNILDKGDTLIETIQGKIGTKIRAYQSYPYLEQALYLFTLQ